MFNFIFFVFCTSEPLQEFPNQVPGLNGYWQKTPPAAALAKTESEAVNYFSYLKESVAGSEIETRNIGEYGKVTGKTHQGGALLTVTGYKVFVANFTFEKVLASHISALINTYKLLSNKPEVKAMTSASAPKSPNKQPESGNTNSTSSAPAPAPAPKSPNKQPESGNTNSTSSAPAPAPKSPNKQPESGNTNSTSSAPAPAPKSPNKQPESGNTNSTSSAAAQNAASNKLRAYAAIDATTAPSDKKNKAKGQFDTSLSRGQTADQAWTTALTGFLNSKNRPFSVTKPSFL